MLDYTAPSTILGKPTNADLALGLATAPVLFAWKDYPELGPMIKRKFEYEGDVARVCPSGPWDPNVAGERVSSCVGWTGKNERIGNRV